MRFYLLIIVLFVCQFQGFAQTQDPKFQSISEKLSALFYHVEHNYVDSVDLDGIVDDAIREVLSELDPHSVYIPAKEVAKANEGLEGNFEGIGVQFNILKDTILVVSPIAGGPSEILGILAGDKIVSIDRKGVVYFTVIFITCYNRIFTLIQ